MVERYHFRSPKSPLTRAFYPTKEKEIHVAAKEVVTDLLMTMARDREQKKISFRTRKGENYLYSFFMFKNVLE